MIKAKITSKAGASLEWELPANIHELHHALVEMGTLPQGLKWNGWQHRQDKVLLLLYYL